RHSGPSSRSCSPRGSEMKLPARFGSLSLLTRAVVASALVAALVAATFGLMLVAVSNLSRSTNVQARTRDVTTTTLNVQQVVNQLESSLRAYLLTGNQRFLTAWQKARDQLDPSLTDVTKLLDDQPRQLQKADQLASLVHAYVSEYGDPLIG